MRGPLAVDTAPTTVVLVVRRYRCTACGVVITVVPRGVAPRRHYGHAAIALALTLWAIAGWSVAAVRRRVAAWPITNERADTWRALRRWAAAQRVPLGLAAAPLRVVAARMAQVALGRAPPSLCGAPLPARAFAGGSAMA